MATVSRPGQPSGPSVMMVVRPLCTYARRSLMGKGGSSVDGVPSSAAPTRRCGKRTHISAARGLQEHPHKGRLTPHPRWEWRVLQVPTAPT